MLIEISFFENKFLNFATVVIIISIIGFIMAIVFQFFKKISARVLVDDVFFVNDENEKYLYVFIDKKTTTMTKNGFYDTHYCRFKKFNLSDFSVEFNVKLYNFTSSQVCSGTNIIGLNEKYVFLEYKSKLLVVDAKTGAVLFSNKQIIKNNPMLKNFRIEDVKYSNSDNTVVVFTQNKGAYLLNPEEITVEKVNYLKFQNSDICNCQRIKKLSKINLSNQIIQSEDAFDYSFLSDSFDVNFIRHKIEQNKYFVKAVSIDNSESLPYSKLEKSFENPKIFYNFIDENGQYFSILIHSVKINFKQTETYISCVTKNSIEVWKIALKDVICSAEKMSDKILRCYYFDKILYFYFESSENNVFCVSFVDFFTGRINGKPVSLLRFSGLKAENY